MSARDVDVVIIGGGVAGTSIARELSKYRCDVVLLEKNTDVCFGVTKGTHSFIHCGIPSASSPLVNKASLQGNALIEKTAEELEVAFRRVGKLLIAIEGDDVSVIQKKYEAAKSAKVPGVRMVEKDEIKSMEPNISSQVVKALYTPTTGLINPWDYVCALSENAKNNGVEFHFDCGVNAIERMEGGKIRLITDKGSFTGAFVVNAAGMYADDVSAMISEDFFRMSPLKQERYVLDERFAGMVNHLVRSGVSGDFVSPTLKEPQAVSNNIILGYTSKNIENKEDFSTTRDGAARIIRFAKRLFPFISESGIITSFAGQVPKNTYCKDYIISPVHSLPTFINIALGTSGVTSSVYIAQMVTGILKTQGLSLLPKKSFEPKRKAIMNFRTLSIKEKDSAVATDPKYGHIICRCETVTEGEIIEAIKRGATTLDGIKFRTRAGMGRCQGGFCTPRIIAILSRELGIPVTELTKKGNISHLLLSRK